MSYHLRKMARLMSDLLENVLGAAYPAHRRAVRNGVLGKVLVVYPLTRFGG